MIATTTPTTSLAQSLTCSACGRLYDIKNLQGYATCCNVPLVVNYQLTALSKSTIKKENFSMWRYTSFLPVFNEVNIVSLGEGWTPIYTLYKLASQIGLKKILVKDEGINPTGSFKARGLSAAISKLKELQIDSCIIPTAGNAGSALAAYAAKAGIKATVVMPAHTSAIIKEECAAYNAELVFVKGLINDCAVKAKQIAANTTAFDISTMKEPYRLEGKKTLGYEIAEQLSWQLPDVIIYPTGGGTGLIGMWKAFQEMKEMGWINGAMPRMIIVQTENCDPMIQLFENGEIADNFTASATKALGLAVPQPFAKSMIQQVVKLSNGTAVRVSESEIEQGIQIIAKNEGMLLSPEGSATFMGLKKLIEKDYIQENETVLLVNTGAWFKYH